ncbi:MAG TPA: sigma-70 family RNA polymerase sigma factor [Vicinamibacterales bacterium]|jgi:RNA polymerase sigma-70 factor (ECF subfamily)|nr:sigma-70 family RNA polymerase sigma factor [Vicinamibacterales bacterium]
MNAAPVSVALPAEAAPDDPAARLGPLFDLHEERLYRLARRLTASADEARDLVQDTFLKAARALPSVPRGVAREEAWLVRVLVNIRRDQWRKAAIRHRAASALREDLAVASDVESAVIARRLVWSALDQLEPRRRAIVVMHELEGMTAAAIAATLGLRRMTVHWHLSMGRKDLRRVLAPHMGETT